MKTPEDLRQLLETPIDWEQDGDETWLLHAVVKGQHVKLELGDFPQEPVCKLTLESREYQVNVFPDHWTLPKHRAEMAQKRESPNQPSQPIAGKPGSG